MINQVASWIPFMKTPDQQQELEMWKKATDKGTHVVNTMKIPYKSPFNFESKNIEKVMAAMSPEEREIFLCDTRAIKWPEYIKNIVIGTALHILKEDHIDPSKGFE